MVGRLPWLGLRAFAEVGRLGSIKAAAESLGVTPGAVSQQIKLLEARLQVDLLRRGNREVALTPAGAWLHGPLSAGFQQIEEAVDSVGRRGPARQSLTISTVASFAAAWLVPRLGGFTARHPTIEVRIETTSRPVDLKSERVDVALRHGLGDYPGLRAEKLLDLRLLPVASPALLAEGPPIREAADCLGFPLLHDLDRADWPLWLRAQGVAAARSRQARNGPSFTDDFLRIRAAAAGQGIALVRDLYVAEEIAAGRLAVALDGPWPAPFAYYLVTRPSLARTPKVRAFRDWILGEARATAPDEGPPPRSSQSKMT